MQTAILGTRQGEQLTLDSGEAGGRKNRPVKIIAAARQAELFAGPDADGWSVTLADGQLLTLAVSDWCGTAAAIVGRHFHRGRIV